MRGALAGAACVAATAVAVLATRHAPYPSGSPIDPSRGWHGAWIAAVIAALVLGGIGVILGRTGALRLRVAVVVAVAVQALPLAAPLLLSQDAYTYWAEARVVTVHASNPYRVTPSQYPSDPATRVASKEWAKETEPYGPAWVAAGALPALAAGRSADRAQLGYRVLALVGVLTLVAIVAFRRRSPAGVALVGWSPLIALHYTGGGHSDALMMAALAGALVLGASPVGAPLWPLAALVKPVPAVFLPLDLARRRLRVSRSFWVALVGSSVALLVVCVGAFGTAWVKGSLEGVHGTSPIGGVHFLTEAGIRHRYAVLMLGLVFVAVYVALLRRAWRDGKGRLGFAAAAFCMCSSLLRPWYALWPLGLAALEDDDLSVLAAFALSAYVLLADAIPT